MKSTLKVLCAASVGLAAGVWFYKQYPRLKILPKKDKPIAGKRKIACIGDSITYGAGVTYHRKKEAWPYVLNALLGEQWQVLNYGISGATAQFESETVFKIHDYLDDAAAAKPELYLMMLGTNDAKTVNWRPEEFRRDYNTMIDRIQTANPDAKLILMTPPITYPEQETGVVACGIDGDIVHEQTVPAVQEIAAARNLPLIDLHTFTDGHPEWFMDGVHPNAEGNRQIADYLYRQLEDIIMLSE